MLKISRKYRISWSARIVTIFLSIFLSLPAILGTFEESSGRVKLENRNMEPLPDYTLLFSDTVVYFSELDNFINDHFGLSVFLNSINKKIQFYIFNDSPATNVTLGEDGYVFLNSHNPNRKNTVFKKLCVSHGNASDFSSVHNSWAGIINYMTLRRYRSVLSVVPSKPVLYPEKLPDSTPEKLRTACQNYNKKENLISRLVRASKKEGWSVYYPYQTFYNQRYIDNFFPKQSFHWHGHSAHVFATGLLALLGIDIPDSYSEHKRDTNTFADMISPIGFKRSIRVLDYDYSSFGVVISAKQPEYVKDYYKKAIDFRETNTKKPFTNRKLLIISNSFGAMIVRHISPAYKQVIQVSINHIAQEEIADFFGEFIEKFSPDDVIFLFHDAGVPRMGKKIYKHILAANKTF